MSRSPVHGRFVWPKPTAKSQLGELDADARWPWSGHMFINHPDVQAVVEDAWEALAHVQRTRRSSAMLVVGESGAGKTRLADRFAAHTRAVYYHDDPERTIVPALTLEVPDGCTPRGFCVEILTALGDPMAERRKVNLTRVVSKLIAACEVRVIIIDNVQDIPTRRRARGIEQVGIRLRELIDQTQCLWLLLGTSTATDVVDSESQLIKRVAYRKSLSYFAIDSANSSKRFLQLLIRIDEWLPLAQSNEALLRKLAGRVFIATEGVLDRVEKLLDLAALKAVQAGREHLIEADFHEGFAKVYSSDISNAFASDFVVRRLSRLNEPFEKLGAAPKEDEEESLKKRHNRRGGGK